MSRFVCVHGHFYQPPRENPWLEIVELQESASPWHDWNDRITAECYRRNTASRILDKDGNIRKICNNFSSISFNVGPTLMSWLKENSHRCYYGILAADKSGIERFSGHGPAVAQVYNHMIMPLANRRDKVTQVKWGIADFKSHFGRMPEGMWLAETAVDTETLEVLAENGILYTILAPNQAEEVRSLKEPDDWCDVKWGKIDPGMAYRCNLPSGKSISLFFYDGIISHDIAFGGLLHDGGSYAKHLIDAQPEGSEATISHVATDGESYGHHHLNGDMALAYCLETIEKSSAQLTIYGEFLEINPPAHEVRIVENSSWSCSHGVERWRSDCGCSGNTPGYHQKWRTPLRNALDWLRDKLAVLFEHEGEKYLKNPWEARNDYVSVILDRSDESVDRWFQTHLSRELTEEEKIKVLKLMESQRAALLMFTSCGWFFDEISGLETIQILRYAARAISLIRELTGLDFDIEFARLLERAPSNVPELSNGRRIYELLVKPAQVSFERLAAHYGLSKLFPELMLEFSGRLSGGCWGVTGENTVCETESEVAGSKAFAAGKVTVSSRITREKRDFVFAANYRGDTAVVCGISPLEQGDSILLDTASLRNTFAESSEKKLIEMFGHNFFSMRHILNYAQRAMVHKLLELDALRIEKSLVGIVSDYHGLFEYLATLNVKAPPIICSAAGIVLTYDMVRILKEEVPDLKKLRMFMARSRQWNVTLDNENIERELQTWVTRQMRVIFESPANRTLIELVKDVIVLFTSEFCLYLDLYEAQNYYCATQREITGKRLQLGAGARDSFRRLGEVLRFADEAIMMTP